MVAVLPVEAALGVGDRWRVTNAMAGNEDDNDDDDDAPPAGAAAAAAAAATRWGANRRVAGEKWGGESDIMLQGIMGRYEMVFITKIIVSHKKIKNKK